MQKLPCYGTRLAKVRKNGDEKLLHIAITTADWGSNTLIGANILFSGYPYIWATFFQVLNT